MGSLVKDPLSVYLVWVLMYSSPANMKYAKVFPMKVDICSMPQDSPELREIVLSSLFRDRKLPCMLSVN